ncbi:MAG: M20 family metallopeptidase [Lentisphaerae bacterium]|nr:M20 family metallopeptidase [Lentisphaerota bacterium]
MIVELLQELIRIPSENNGVTGYEYAVQKYYYDFLRNNGIDAEMIFPDEIPGFAESPGRLKEHLMYMRPAVIASLTGNRPGKTLLLLAHADTVPVGEIARWETPPFSGMVKDGRIYGRGSGDDKFGMAVMAGLIIELKKRNCDFPGKLIIASVPDEESGGGNGTAAVFAHGITADEAVFLDGGSNQTVWNAGMGGGFCTISGGDTEEIKHAVYQVKEEIIRKIENHPCFGERFYQTIGKRDRSMSVTDGAVTFFYDTLPGDDEEALKAALEAQLPGCSFKWMSRFLKPAYVPENAPIIRDLGEAFRKVTGREMAILGGIQSDQGLVMMLADIPCIDFGCSRRGLPGGPHQPDEFIEIKVLEEVYEALLEMIVNRK